MVVRSSAEGAVTDGKAPLPHVVAALIDLDDFVASCELYGDSWGRARHRAVGDVVDRLVRAEGGGTRCRAMPPDEWFVTFEGTDPTELTERAVGLAQAVRDIARDQYAGGVTVGVSPPCHGPAAGPAAERHARGRVGYKLVSGGNRIIAEVPEGAEPGTVPSGVVRALVCAARAGRRDDVVRILVAAAEGVAPAELPGAIGGLLLTVLDCAGPLRADGGTDWTSLGSHIARMRLTELAQVHERSHLRVWIERTVGELMVHPVARQMGPVERAEAYLRDHYNDYGLTLTDVAGAVRVSPYYLAHLFRSERGSTFRRELTAIRMGAARRLLANGSIPIHRVAVQVGFTGLKTFRVVFKRDVGCAPSEYRARCAERVSERAS